MALPVQLTIRHHRDATGAHWRRGVFLRHRTKAYKSEALLELRSENELEAQVRAPSPDMYFNVIRDSSEDLIAKRWPGGVTDPAASHSGDLYSQPWDYGQPLRYADGEGAYPYPPPAFDAAAYNGGDYSLAGTGSPGYDLSGIIDTGGFEAIGYDDPDYWPLSYDAPRYVRHDDDGPVEGSD